jgi:hypothetical protein
MLFGCRIFECEQWIWCLFLFRLCLTFVSFVLGGSAAPDPLVSRQLVDHFLNELVTIALDCLSRRKTHRKFPGDVSYALMGLIRRRPAVEPRDSESMAFARLSLANDSDRLRMHTAEKTIQ